MRGFIEITLKGRRMTVRADAISRVYEERHGSHIFIAGESLEVEESYEEVKERLKKATDPLLGLTCKNGPIFVPFDKVHVVDTTLKGQGGSIMLGGDLVAHVYEPAAQIAAMIRGE
jgi:uncharacterized protein YlzI (FlbEa/FlbD family)